MAAPNFVTAFPLETGALPASEVLDAAHVTADAPSPTQHFLAARSWADPSNCVDDYVDTESQCDHLQTEVNSCVSMLDAGNGNLHDSRFVNCFCVADIYTGLVKCQNQHRLCLRDFVMDHQFSHYQDQWKTFCTSELGSVDVTEPPLITPEPVTSFKNGCSYIKSACNRYSQYTSDCQSYFTQSACYCQSHVVQMESICSIDGIAMCSKSKIENASTIWGYASCHGRSSEQSSFDIPTWAFADAKVDPPKTVPFAAFPLTYNDVPTPSPTAADPASTAAGHQILLLFLVLQLLLLF